MSTIQSLHLCNKKFNVIYADPPWQYKDFDTTGAAEKHYHTMPLQEIINLPIKNLRSENCSLFLWVTNAFLQEGLTVMKSWGFNQKTIITWCKEPGIGTGHYFRNTTEQCLFGTYGKVRLNHKNIKTHFIAKRLGHSTKPDVMYKIIEENFDPPYLELFAREHRSGWYVWGDEVSSVVVKKLEEF